MAETYVELHARSAFNFLRGGSFPEQMAEVAEELKIRSLALHDRDGVYGAPRFYQKAGEHGLRPLIGCELTMEDRSVLPVLVKNRQGYQNLCRLLTRSKLRGTKAESHVQWDELPELSEGLVALTGDEDGPLARILESKRDPWPLLQRLIGTFGKDNVFVEIQRHLIRGESRRNQRLVELSRQAALLLLATNGVHYATPHERCVTDLFTCIRNHTTFEQAGRLLEINGERHLKGPGEMKALFRDVPEAIANTARLAERLEFTLEDLGYKFPVFPVAEGDSMEGMLIRMAYKGAARRYQRITEKVKKQLEKELELICRLGFAGYFLIVWDLVKFCQESGIMVQGRGSAANSVVCYCLEITNCDPIKYKLLFERFLSEGRNPQSWPDIDLDLPSGDRRERVIQEVYRRYGERGAAMVANVITYRGRSAAREIGKALGFTSDLLDRFSKLFANGDFPETLDFRDQLAKAGLPAGHPQVPAFVALYQAIRGLPRHLGQHSGGMVICQQSLDSVVPLERASMPGRVVMQWDKDDCEELGMVKIDLLGLGMLSVVQDAVTLCGENGKPVELHKLPKDDPATYEMIQQADTIGVFQIESRAQMATLPRMKPKEFYDLVIEVAIIRPGPIQGGLMHPYLARRQGKEPESYFGYDRELKPILERTLGVPIFQEQMLSIAMVMADFTGSQAEELRRALSFHRSHERMQKVQVKLRTALERKGIVPKSIDEIVSAVTSFALYGFPESHAISFAYLAYASSWLKVHRAPEFYASLLNNQPMGFYSSATLIQDGRRHHVKFRAVSLEESNWECTIEPDDSVRLGLCVVEGLSRGSAQGLLIQRKHKSFESTADLRRRTSLTKKELRVLAEIGAFNNLAGHRRGALWQVDDFFDPDDLFCREANGKAAVSPLERMTLAERSQADYAGMRLSLGPHPMALLRPLLDNVWAAADLSLASNGQTVRIAGSVICRQRPGTAKGFVFISLEDETGVANAIVTPDFFEKWRLLITEEPFLIIEGRLQNAENVIHVRAQKIEPLPHEDLVPVSSHDFH